MASTKLAPWFILLLFYFSLAISSLVPFQELEKHSLFLPGPLSQNHRIVKRAANNFDRGGTLKISNFNVQSDIRYRYSCTYFTSTVRNRGHAATEVSFQVVLPETGFISKFVMEIDGKSYEAYVKEKDEAKRIYNEAQERGQSAGLVELNSRYSNIFNVNINIQSSSSVRFNLTYEEFLQRKLGRYEQIINITPNQVYNVEDVGITVTIEETNKLKSIEIPKLKFNELEIESGKEGNNLDAELSQPETNRAHIYWKPSKSDIETLQKNGGIGKFVVRYDVQRETEAGEVLVMNGYFVHFFAPPNLKSLKKHIVFVLDISGSMIGRKIEQLKEAMKKILGDLKEDEDYFNIIIFSSGVTHWTPNYNFETTQSRRNWPRVTVSRRLDDIAPVNDDYKISYYKPFPASKNNVAKAQQFIQSLIAEGGTNINDALKAGLSVTQNSDEELLSSKGIQSMMIFLTDGEPTVGNTDLESIQRNVRNSNEISRSPIFTLAFGQSADFNFLKKLSLQNYGFARKIYEAADAKLQLEGFYKEISSPLLKDVKFTYTNKGGEENKNKIIYEIDDLTIIKFNTLFEGNEIVIAGKLKLQKGDEDANNEPIGAEKSQRKGAASAPFTGELHGSKDLFIRNWPTDVCHFPVVISGCGRDNICTTWEQPTIYSYRYWQWRCPPFPRLPPTTTVAPVTKEDYFLERFWAYLTIQQLIDKDFASTSGEGLSSSDMRRKALNLALEYGFVTPLTSLVVVKPDDTTNVAEPLPIDDFSARQSSGQGIKFKRGKTFVAHKMSSPGSASGGRYPMMNGASFGGASSLRESFKDSFDSSQDSFPAAGSRPPPPPRVPSEPAATSEAPTTKAKYYDLYDIKWLKMQMDRTLAVTIKLPNGNIKIFDIATDTSGKNMDLVQKECVINRGGVKLHGECKYLQDCIQEEFINDFDAYEKSYFCVAETKVLAKQYAGACCPT